MPPSYILQSMTINAAELLGLENSRGVLEKSYYTDIIALKSNPLDNIDAINSVQFVMKEGKVRSDEIS
ncbi:amidohydrolase family protein [Daejeonella sp.]|uniref:amidohydrolase family protein n=1 Tax=Daejeonella sp. TaxID=2805397 RepID=UPI0027BAD250|nr:amidohydrolase family protein [Daejeonella sp.]